MTQTFEPPQLIEAPFISQTVHNLNTFQTHTSGGFMGHPYTCANRGDGHHGWEGGDLGVLIATHEGWVCPHCDYVQLTAHPMMAQSTKPSTERSLGRPSIAQIREMIVRHIQAYQNLLKAKPSASGVRIMISSLEEKIMQLKDLDG